MWIPVTLAGFWLADAAIHVAFLAPAQPATAGGPARPKENVMPKIVVPVVLSLVATLIAVVATRLVAHRASRAEVPGVSIPALPTPAG